MKIGVCGTGRMGSALAQRLLSVGREVTVWNRDAAKTMPLVQAGAKHAISPAELVAGCDTVIVMLLNDEALESVYRRPRGLLMAGLDGKQIIDMSTVLPETMSAIGDAVVAAGGGFVECPVGGTVGPAREGKLLGLAGGSAEDFARARPVLEQLCRRLEHVGGRGAGATMKLAVNLPLLVYLQALGEALAICKPLNLPAERLIDILSDTSGTPNAMKMRGPDIARLLGGGERSPTYFSVSGGLKDLTTAVSYAMTLDTELPVAASAAACFAEAEAAGLSDRDVISTVPVHWATRNANR